MLKRELRLLTKVGQWNKRWHALHIRGDQNKECKEGSY